MGKRVRIWNKNMHKLYKNAKRKEKKNVFEKKAGGKIIITENKNNEKKRTKNR